MVKAHQEAFVSQPIDFEPCPYCGAQDGQPHGPTIFTEQHRSFVGCIVCGARGPIAYDGDEALAKAYWNKRAAERGE